MDATAVALLACPACQGPLTAERAGLGCPSGHSYDLARQGYVNLLGGPEPANADTAAMLAARARVQEAGCFDPLAGALAAAADGHVLAEVGAGTAFYLARAVAGDEARIGVALDVSKAAARVAARTHPRISAVVADAWRRWPLQDHCLDALLCVFAPRNPSEFARVLRPDGRLVVATPNPGHLSGLRDRYRLLDVPAEKAARLTASLAAAGFVRRAEVPLRWTAQLSAELAGDLIAMGPNAFHRLPGAVAATEVDFDITVQVFAAAG